MTPICTISMPKERNCLRDLTLFAWSTRGLIAWKYSPLYIKRRRERITGNMDLKASGNVLEGSRNHGNIRKVSRKNYTHCVYNFGHKTSAALLFCQLLPGVLLKTWRESTDVDLHDEACRFYIDPFKEQTTFFDSPSLPMAKSRCFFSEVIFIWIFAWFLWFSICMIL